MNKAQKDTLKADLKDKFSRAKIAIFADYEVRLIDFPESLHIVRPVPLAGPISQCF